MAEKETDWPATTGSPTWTWIESATSRCPGSSSARSSSSAISATGAGSTVTTVAGRRQAQLERLDLLARRASPGRLVGVASPSVAVSSNTVASGGAIERIGQPGLELGIERGGQLLDRGVDVLLGDLRELLVRPARRRVRVDDLERLGVLALAGR